MHRINFLLQKADMCMLVFCRERFPEESPQNQRLRHIAQIVVKFNSSGTVRYLPQLEGIDLRLKYPLSSLDYQACALSLQQVHMNAYRHFLFITGFSVFFHVYRISVPKKHRNLYVTYRREVARLS